MAVVAIGVDVAAEVVTFRGPDGATGTEILSELGDDTFAAVVVVAPAPPPPGLVGTGECREVFIGVETPTNGLPVGTAFGGDVLLAGSRCDPLDGQSP